MLLYRIIQSASSDVSKDQMMPLNGLPKQSSRKENLPWLLGSWNITNELQIVCKLLIQKGIWSFLPQGLQMSVPNLRLAGGIVIGYKWDSRRRWKVDEAI